MVFILFAAIGYAPPGEPHMFYGDVTVNGAPASDGLLVTANIGGSDVAATSTEEGKYMLVVANSGTYEDKTVSFFIEYRDTGETVRFSSAESGKTNIDLQASISLSEPDDTDASDTDSPGNGGNSGSISISVASEDCTPDWKCTDWLNCIGGTQKRICRDQNDCSTDTNKPIEKRDCQLSAELKSDTETNTEIAQQIAAGLEEENDSDPESKGFTGITGRSVQNAEPQSLLIGMIVLVGISIVGVVAYNKFWR